MDLSSHWVAGCVCLVTTNTAVIAIPIANERH